MFATSQKLGKPLVLGTKKDNNKNKIREREPNKIPVHFSNFTKNLYSAVKNNMMKINVIICKTNDVS